MATSGSVGKKSMVNGIDVRGALEHQGIWFEKANLTIEEVLKFTYWWCQDLRQWQIKQQLGLGPHTAFDWDMFCREVCEIALFEGREKIGGPGKLVQIDESKIGKRKYHRVHVVEGQ